MGMSATCQAKCINRLWAQWSLENYAVGPFYCHDVTDIRTPHHLSNTKSILTGMENPSEIVEVPALGEAKMTGIVTEALREQVEIAQIVEVGKFCRNIILFHAAKIVKTNFSGNLSFELWIKKT